VTNIIIIIIITI